MALSRKEFLLSIAGLLTFAGGLSRNSLINTASLKPLNGNEMSILYDSSKCIGCRHCEEGCIKENNLPKNREQGELSENAFTAIKTFKNGNDKNILLKRQCMHCTDASCVSVCPTGAAAHHGEYVVIDQDVCIGCGYCIQACPFGIPQKGEPPEGTANKCTFCLERIESGKKPACADACPIGATAFGTRTDQLTIAKNRVQTLSKTGMPEARLYGENEVGGLHVMNILLKPPAFYGLPEQPRQATRNVVAQWASGSLAAAVLVVPFWYLFKRMSKKDKELSKQKEGAK